MRAYEIADWCGFNDEWEMLTDNLDDDELMDLLRVFVYSDKEGFTQVDRDEEYVAELFRVYVANPNDVKGKSKGILQKIVDFFKSILDAITGAGFETPLSVLEDIKTGKIGARERDKLRSNKDILAEQANADVPTVDLKFNIDEDKLRK